MRLRSAHPGTSGRCLHLKVLITLGKAVLPHEVPCSGICGTRPRASSGAAAGSSPAWLCSSLLRPRPERPGGRCTSSPLWRVLVLLCPCPWTRPLCPWFPVALARGVAGVSAPRSPRAHSGPPGFPPDVGQPCFRVRLRGLRPRLHFPPKVHLFSRRCV